MRVARNASAATAVSVIVSTVVVASPVVDAAASVDVAELDAELVDVSVEVDAVDEESAVALAVDEVVADVEDGSVVVLQAAREPARARAATEDAKRNQNCRKGDEVEVVIGKDHRPLLSPRYFLAVPEL